jgi:oligoribonuclease
MADRTKGMLVWMDMEMTGLDPEANSILEIATIITDSNLNVIANGPELVVGHDQATLEKMDNWNREHHKKSGLWEAAVASEITLAEAEQQTLAFLKKHTKANESPLCGNSIWQDRRFLRRYMPKIDEHLHYRLLDVSAFKEAISRWYPKPNPPEKKSNHRALEDVIESIEELKYYRANYLKPIEG